MKKYVLSMTDGSAAIMVIIDDSTTIENEINKSVLKNQILEHKEVTEEQIPVLDDYMNAWEFDSVNGIKINMNKAKEIHLNKLRALKKVLPEPIIDDKYLVAVDKALTVEELKSIVIS